MRGFGSNGQSDFGRFGERGKAIQNSRERALGVSIIKLIRMPARYPKIFYAEIQSGLIRRRFQLFIGIQSGLRLTLCLEILRSAEINFVGSAIHRNICMDQLIGQMRNPQHRQQPVNDQLVHTLMPNDAACFIKV